MHFVCVLQDGSTKKKGRNKEGELCVRHHYVSISLAAKETNEQLHSVMWNCLESVPLILYPFLCLLFKPYNITFSSLTLP
jgi:hypothetical protein